VTGQALGVNLFGRVLRGIEYLAHVAAARHVVRPGTMAALAALVRRTALLIQGGLPMRRFLPGVVSVLVARLTGLRSNVLGGIGVGGGCARRLRAGGLALSRSPALLATLTRS
jgi:hypothetical protein